MIYYYYYYNYVYLPSTYYFWFKFNQTPHKLKPNYTLHIIHAKTQEQPKEDISTYFRKCLECHLTQILWFPKKRRKIKKSICYSYTPTNHQRHTTNTTWDHRIQWHRIHFIWYTATGILTHNPQQHLKLHHTTSSRHTAALHTSTTFSASPYIHIIVTLKFYYIEIMNSTYTWPYPKPYIIWRSFRKNPHCTLLRTIRNIYEFFPFFFPLSIFFFLFE